MTTRGIVLTNEERRKLSRGLDPHCKKTCGNGLVIVVKSILAERVRAAQVTALREAADDIQALHPGEVKNSVIWLRERADAIESDGTDGL